MKKIKRIYKATKKKNPFRNYKLDYPVELTIPVQKLIEAGYTEKQEITIRRGNTLGVYQFVKVNSEDYSVTYRRRRVIVNISIPPVQKEDEVIL